jgi:hypothetical protein
MADNQKPSFMRSMISGIAGYAKGAIAGGLVGALAGAAIGGVIALFSPEAGIEIFKAIATAGTQVPALGATAIGAIGGALSGGAVLASIGAFTGAITGVVKSREVAQQDLQQVADIAKASFAQGMAMGQELEQQRSKTPWQDRIAAERTQTQSGPTLH